MNRHLIWAIAALVAMLVWAGRSFAQFSVTITVDENGVGTFHNTAGLNEALPFAMSPDPGPGGLAAAATYGLTNLPGLVAGDLIVPEPNNTPPQISDIIRFNPNENGGSLVFYSETSDGVDSLADTGFPTALYANTLALDEVGPGLTYTPTAGQPGFVTGAGGPVTYVIASEPVPEPSSILALAGGLAAFACGWRRRARG
jgi:hypothetical protein